jgi:hypothetical protein
MNRHQRRTLTRTDRHPRGLSKARRARLHTTAQSVDVYEERLPDGSPRQYVTRGIAFRVKLIRLTTPQAEGRLVGNPALLRHLAVVADLHHYGDGEMLIVHAASGAILHESDPDSPTIAWSQAERIAAQDAILAQWPRGQTP